MDSNKVNVPVNEIVDIERTLTIQSQNVSNTNVESNEPPVQVFDPMLFGGFDGFKSYFDDDWKPTPGAPTMYCRKAHPLRLKRKPKMRIPYYVPKIPEEEDFDIEPFMLEDFPEEIDWSRQYYQPPKELRQLKPDIISWDYVPPYDPNLAKELEQKGEHISAENITANRVDWSKISVKNFPKFKKEEEEMDLEGIKTFFEEKERRLKFEDWMIAYRGERTNEQTAFDGDWQKDQHEGWGLEERYGRWRADEGFDDEKPFDPEKPEGEGEGGDQRAGGGWGRGGGWNRGMARGGRGGGPMSRGGGFGRGGDRGRGGFRGGFARGFARGGAWGGGGDLSRGFSRGGRGRGSGRGRGWEDHDDGVDVNAKPNFPKTLLDL